VKPPLTILALFLSLAPFAEGSLPRWSWDEAGNLSSSRLPGRAEETFSRDARGALLARHLGDGSTIQYRHDGSGARRGYIDQVDEVTSTHNDLVGRPKLREYADGTSELFTYEGPRLSSYSDRQGRTRILGYDEAGRVSTISNSGGEIIERIEYGLDGRVARRATRDGGVRYLEYDLAGRPLATAQERYADGSGTSSTPVVLDRYEQSHGWNVHGERTSWTMPAYEGFAPAFAWTATVSEGHDLAGNVTAIERTLTGGGGGGGW
jgi:YD repeat-containing protein